MAAKAEQRITAQDRALAQLALATGEVSPQVCPDVADLALLVDGRAETGPDPLSAERRESLWNHLAHCPSCYEQWRIIVEVQHPPLKKTSRAKIISITGGLLAAAASIMLFVNIHDAPMVEVSMERTQVMELLDAPPEEVADELSATGDIAGSAPSLSEGRLASEPKMEQVQKRSQPLNAAQVRKEMIASPAPRVTGGVNDLELDFMADAPFENLNQGLPQGEILLDLNRVIPTVLQRVKQAETGTVIEVKTYKRDRGFRVEKRGDGQVFIQEYGFHNQAMNVTMPQLKKILKTMLKTEFPRSNKVWMSMGTVRSRE